MLQLRDYKYTSLVTQNYSYFDENLITASGRLFGYIGAIHIEQAMLPYVMNDIKIAQSTAVWDHELDTKDKFDTIMKYFKDMNASDKIAINKLYTRDVSKVLELLNTDLYINPKSGIQELYNKAMSQAQERENLDRDVHIVVKVNKVNKELLIITDWRDYNQMSDMFLTIGLLPVLFPDISNAFCEEEMEYFKTLVARSQVKRISNVKATEDFSKLSNLTKYKDVMLKIKLNSTIQRLIEKRISSSRNEIASAEDEANRYLEAYTRAINKYNTAQKLLKDLEAGTEALEEEYKQALSMDAILDINVDDRKLVITLSAPVEYYNTDEVECFLRHEPDGSFKSFITDVFLNQKFKLHVMSQFVFDTKDPGNFRAPYSLNSSYFNKYDTFYNPHFQYYSCLGDYKPTLAKAHADQDLLLFNNIAIAATKSFNFADGAVMSNFRASVKEYFNSPTSYSSNDFMTSKCLEDEDGNRYSLKEIYIDKVLDEDDFESDDETVETIEVREV